MYHFLQLGAGALEVVVDDAHVVLRGALHLGPGVLEAQAHLLLALGAAAAQPPLELGHAGGLDEHEDRVGHDGADGEAALDVDLQDDGLPAREDALDLAAKGPVAMGVDPRPLQELPRREATVELGVVHEVVGDAVLLTFARLPRRRRDRQPQAGHPLAQKRDERALAYA